MRRPRNRNTRSSASECCPIFRLLWQPSCRWHHDVIKPQLERLFFLGHCTIDDLWLNSAKAIELSKRSKQPLAVSEDGWGVGG